MADFRLSVSKPLSRGKGQSAIAKAAYNARARLVDERTGQTKDYRRAGGLVWAGIFPGAKDAGSWAQDRGQLWNRAEQAEKRKDSRLAQEVQISLPHEMTGQQRQWLVTDFVREQFTRKGITADVAIHAPSPDGDQRNHHAHILIALRDIGPDGFGKKLPDCDEKQIRQWREAWAKLQNRHLERHGIAARVDHRSFAAQGIERKPTEHRGPQVCAIARREIEADITNQKTEPADELADLRAQLAVVEMRIAAETATAPAPKPPTGNTGGVAVKRSFHVVAVALLRRVVRSAVATLGRFRLSVPRIKNRDAQIGEVLDVPGNDGELVMKRGRHDQAVSNRDLLSLQPTLSGENTPALRNRSRHRQNAAFKPRAQRPVEPLL